MNYLRMSAKKGHNTLIDNTRTTQEDHLGAEQAIDDADHLIMGAY